MEALVHLWGVRAMRGDRLVLEGVDWTLGSGEAWAAFGPNGAGKSTLLELVAGTRTPAEGRRMAPPGLRVSYVPQEPALPADGTLGAFTRAGPPRLREAEARMRAEERRLATEAGALASYARSLDRFEALGGHGALARLAAHASTLLPGRPGTTPLASLSPGERKRLALAAALAEPADVLVLDEPTNALDLPARRWLAERLRAFEATLVLASHDRDLLAQVGRHTLEVRDGRVWPSRRSFAQEMRARRTEARTAERAEREARKEAARLDAARERTRRWGTPAVQGQRRVLGRRAEAAHRVRSEAAATEASGDAPAPWPVAATAPARGEILRAHGLTVPPVLADASLRLDAGAKVALLGANGSGKSTVLRILARELRELGPDAEVHERDGLSVWHLDARRRGLRPDATVGAQVERWVSRGRVAPLLAAVGLVPDRAGERPDALSDGERTRAGLAVVLAREADLWLLDEPEAGLDLPALQALEGALRRTGATVVLATHDARLADAVAEDAWGVRDGQVVRYRGGVRGFLAGRLRQEHAGAPASDGVASAPPAPPSVAQSAPSLEGLEDEAGRLEAWLADPWAWSERERQRLERRAASVTAARMEAYEARSTPPAPRFRAVEPGVALEADVRGDVLDVTGSVPVAPRVRRVGDVVHVSLPEPEGGRYLPWASAALLRAAARLALWIWYPRAVQTPAVTGLAPPAPWDAWNESWWVVEREALLRAEGWSAQLVRTAGDAKVGL